MITKLLSYEVYIQIIIL